jgi:KRAB domain-containing zinc finger protein
MPYEDDIVIKSESLDEPPEEKLILESDDEILYNSDENYDPSANQLKRQRKVKRQTGGVVNNDNSTRGDSPTKKKKCPAPRQRITKLEEVQCYYCSEMMMNTTIKAHMLIVHRQKCLTRMFGEKLPFKCPDCNAALLKDIKEASHKCFKEIATKPEEVQCYYCSKMMMNTTMKDHMLDVHGRKFMPSRFGGKRPFKCPACNAALLKDIKDSNHNCFKYRVQNGELGAGGVAKCNQCDRTFKGQKAVISLELHVQTAHSDDRPFLCDQCEFRAKRSVILRNHVKRVHLQEKKHMCTTCGKAFFDSYELKTHMHVCGVNLPSMCLECNRNFESVRSLRIHNLHKHKIATNPTVTCDQCGQMFNRPVNLKAHYKAEHPTDVQVSEVVCNCEKCHLTFQTSVELNCHLLLCLEKPKNFKCESCDLYNWHSHIALRKHFSEVHRNIRDFCDICGVSFKSASYLPLHKKVVHGGVKENVCDECGKRFGTKNSLSKHIMGVHRRKIEGKHQFKCDKCDYITGAANKLKQHNEATHIREVKYECEQCNYFGYREDVLKNHINSVHKKLVRHNCDHCEMGFYHRREKIKHMEKMHSHK